VGAIVQDGQPAVSRLVKAPELVMKIAQAGGGIVADPPHEKGRVNPFQVLELGRAFGLLEELLRLGVVKEPIGGLPFRGKRRQNLATLPRDGNDEALIPVNES